MILDFYQQLLTLEFSPHLEDMICVLADLILLLPLLKRLRARQQWFSRGFGR